MVSLVPIEVEEKVAIGIVVELPKTRLLAIAGNKGYIMCGALDVHLLNTRLADRRIIAGRATGVRSLDDLLAAPLTDVTDEAELLGIHAGMTGREALRLLV